MAAAKLFTPEGKTAIITGAGSGINFCFAKLLLSRNCNVLIADLSLRPEAQQLIDHYTNKPRAIFQRTDVSSWKDLEAMFATCIREFGDVDIVCPGAGIYEPKWSSFWYPPGVEGARDAPDGDRYASLDINLTHPLRTSQLAISYFLNPSAYHSSAEKASPQNPKRIVFITSTAGECASFATILYTATKHAISGMIHSLGPLEQSGIRCNGIAPGLIKTPLFTDNPDNIKIVSEAEDEWITPEFVAENMLALATSDEYPGGTILRVAKTIEKVPLFNNPGPNFAKGMGHTASGSAERQAGILDLVNSGNWGVPEL